MAYLLVPNLRVILYSYTFFNIFIKCLNNNRIVILLQNKNIQVHYYIISVPLYFKVHQNNKQNKSFTTWFQY